MLVKCPVCGAHAPPAAAVEIPVGDEVRRYCSLRCAESAGDEAAALPPLPAAPRRLLVAVDGSGPSLRATQLAATLAALAGGEVTLLHAVDPALLRLLPLDAALTGAAQLGLGTRELESGLRADAQAQLLRCRRICEQAGVKVGTRIELKAPASAIAEAAEQADLVVLGSRGLGALSGAALGSLSHRVIGETDKPVLVVH